MKSLKMSRLRNYSFYAISGVMSWYLCSYVIVGFLSTPLKNFRDKDTNKFLFIQTYYVFFAKFADLDTKKPRVTEAVES